MGDIAGIKEIPSNIEMGGTIIVITRESRNGGMYTTYASTPALAIYFISSVQLALLSSRCLRYCDSVKPKVSIPERFIRTLHVDKDSRPCLRAHFLIALACPNSCRKTVYLCNVRM